MTSKKVLAFFAGSQDIQDEVSKKSLSGQLEYFLTTNKDTIGKIIYGGGTYGVMGQVLEASRKVGIPIEGYSIERYRKYDEGNGVDMTFFADDDARLKAFTQEGNVFFALPGGLGTIKEILGAKDHILEGNTQKNIYISCLFRTFYVMLEELSKAQMIYGKDKEIFTPVVDLTVIRI